MIIIDGNFVGYHDSRDGDDPREKLVNGTIYEVKRYCHWSRRSLYFLVNIFGGFNMMHFTRVGS